MYLLYSVLIFCFYVTLANCLSAQTSSNVISNESDISVNVLTSESPRIFNDLARARLFADTEKAFVYAKAALKTSLLFKDRKEEARAWYNIGNVFNVKGNYQNANLAYQKSLELRKVLNDYDGMSKVLNNLGVIEVNKGDYKAAIDYYSKSLSYKLQLLDTNGSAGTLANIANLYFLWGRYREAYEYNHKALRLYEQTNNKQGIAICMNHLGAIHENWNDYKSALVCYNSALELEKHNRNMPGMANALNNLGNLFNRMELFDDALKNYQQALEIRKKSADLKGIASTMNNIGTLLTKQGKPELARQYYTEALNISNQINSAYEITVNLFAIGNNYLSLSNYVSAQSYFEKSLAIASGNNLRELTADNYKALALAYSKTGSYDKAYQNLEKYMLLKDSIFSSETHSRMTEIKTRYETEKKQKEIELLKRNIIIQQLQSERIEQKLNLRLIIWLSSAGFILLITFSVLIMLRLNHRRKLIVAEQKALRAQMNPHFIFNALNSIQGVIIEQDEVAARRYLNRFSQLMRSILENSKKTEISLREELSSIDLYLELEKLRFSNRFEYNIDIANEINIDMVKIPPMLIQPLLENAILHGIMPSKSKGRLYLEFSVKDSNLLKIIIKDNGIGRLKAGEINKRRHKHVSTGMKNIQERISLIRKTHRGNIQMRIIDLTDENEIGNGTQVEIILPLHLMN